MSDLSSLIKALDSKIGGSDEKSEVTKWLSTGFPNLNKAMSGRHDGGLGYGRLYEIYGPSSSGKTILATNLMIEAQRKGGVAIFIDYERSFDLGMAIKMGLSDESPFFIYKAPDTWERGNTVAMQACELIRKSGAISNDAPIIVVQDSIASAIPQSVFEKGIEEYNMNDTTALSRVTSTTLKAVASFCNKMDVTCLYLNQIRTKPGISYGDSTTTPGGTSMEFFASGRIALSRTKVMEVIDGEKVMTAQIIKAKVVKSKHTRPFKVAELQMGFNKDGSAFFDKMTVLVDYLVKINVIETAGAYAVYDGKKYYRKALVKKIVSEGLEETFMKMVPNG